MSASPWLPRNLLEKRSLGRKVLPMLRELVLVALSELFNVVTVCRSS